MSKTNNIETSGTEYVFEEGEMTNLSSRDTGPRCSGDVEDGFKPTMHTLQYIVVPLKAWKLVQSFDLVFCRKNH